MKFAFFLSVSLGIIISVLVITGVGNNQDVTGESNGSGVTNAAPPTVVDGTQIIEIAAKGGYSPRETKAQANVPSIIRMKTRGTFDCSSALLIPSLSYASYLPASGSTDIKVPPQEPGTVLRGMCGMGMYNFSISFS